MMHRTKCLLFTVVAVSALAAGAASASQPPDVVQTDNSQNTAMGLGALFDLTSGDFNTAAGYDALVSNTTGSLNSAFGAVALGTNSAGYQNTAMGVDTMELNSTGFNNTAAGVFAMARNLVGNENSAFGVFALYGSSGNQNNALGAYALYSNAADDNSAVGYQAMYYNTISTLNNAMGNFALTANVSGSNNNAIGQYAGNNLTTGNSNIDIGSRGIAGESSIIRIGDAGAQVGTYIAGISTAKVTGSAVYVTSSGQLGVMASSERYKAAIAPMGADTSKLKDLRTVTFRLKTDPEGVTQYGLIAEEVAKVYPELVIRDAAGKVDGVRYEELAPMLLNELQQDRQVAAKQMQMQDKKIAADEAQLCELKHQLAQMQVALKSL